MNVKSVLFSAAFALALAGPRPAGAALGENVSTVNDDAEVLGASEVSKTECAEYTIYRMEVGGTTLKEYATKDGVVFALTWSGIARPELGKVLGRYEAEYRALRDSAVRKRGQRQRRLQSETLTVEEWGHMRSLHGRVFAPALLPKGLSADELQ